MLFLYYFKFGGGGWIWTNEVLSNARFTVWWIKPLSHPSDFIWQRRLTGLNPHAPSDSSKFLVYSTDALITYGLSSSQMQDINSVGYRILLYSLYNEGTIISCSPESYISCPLMLISDDSLSSIQRSPLPSYPFKFHRIQFSLHRLLGHIWCTISHQESYSLNWECHALFVDSSVNGITKNLFSISYLLNQRT